MKVTIKLPEGLSKERVQESLSEVSEKLDYLWPIATATRFDIDFGIEYDHGWWKLEVGK